jgi:hypothetical protein
LHPEKTGKIFSTKKITTEIWKKNLISKKKNEKRKSGLNIPDSGCGKHYKF